MQNITRFASEKVQEGDDVEFERQEVMLVVDTKGAEEEEEEDEKSGRLGGKFRPRRLRSCIYPKCTSAIKNCCVEIASIVTAVDVSS